jgi:transposase-like protein
MKTGVTVSRPEHPQKRVVERPQQSEKMILSVCVKLNEIYSQGRKFNWTKPDACPRCGSVRLWGHGYIMRYFDGFANGLLLRRYRCPDCGCVIRMKPEGYFPRFQARIDTIRRCLARRLTGRWCCGMSTSRQRHWLSALRRNIVAVFGTGLELMDGFDRLLQLGLTPVSRTI